PRRSGAWLAGDRTLAGSEAPGLRLNWLPRPSRAVEHRPRLEPPKASLARTRWSEENSLSVGPALRCSRLLGLASRKHRRSARQASKFRVRRSDCVIVARGSGEP